MRLLLLLTLLLTGCGTTLRNDIQSEQAELASPPTTQLNLPAPAVKVEIVTPTTPVLGQHGGVFFEQPTGSVLMLTKPEQFEREILQAEPVRKAQNKVANIVKKAVEKVVSGAEAAVVSTKVTKTTDGEGNVVSVVEVKDTDSLLVGLGKLVALLTSTLGLYVGFKKLREPVRPAA